MHTFDKTAKQSQSCKELPQAPIHNTQHNKSPAHPTRDHSKLKDFSMRSHYGDRTHLLQTHSRTDCKSQCTDDQSAGHGRKIGQPLPIMKMMAYQDYDNDGFPVL